MPVGNPCSRPTRKSDLPVPPGATRAAKDSLHSISVDLPYDRAAARVSPRDSRGLVMSAPQLDILALEPFYGGARRAMLETIVRCSRHRWTVLKLPPRRIERRLAVAANWFAEQLTRHWVGRVDLLFTSEAMNLTSLFELMPQIARKPTVVYFHDNQLPDVHTNTDAPLDLVNLSTARAATETWFNSAWHQKAFLARATSVLERHQELGGLEALWDIQRKMLLVTPPVDMHAVHQAAAAKVRRDPAALFVETRDADVTLLNKALAILRERGQPLRLITVGPVLALPADVPRQALPETDDAAHARGLCEAGVFVSVKTDAASDFLVVRGLTAGCRPVLPASGFYPELLPGSLQRSALYDVAPALLADRIQDAIGAYAIPAAALPAGEIKAALKPFDAIATCREIDEKFEELVWVRALD